LREFEAALPVNGFRLRHLADNDADFDYSTPVGEHPHGCCEIEAVVEKISRPGYSGLIELTGERKDYIEKCERVVVNAVAQVFEGKIGAAELKPLARQLGYFPAYEVIRAELVDNRRPAIPESYLRAILRSALTDVRFDDALYLRLYPDIKEAITGGVLPGAREHFVVHGYFEGRVFQQDPASSDPHPVAT